jgi:hypothetical protein
MNVVIHFLKQGMSRENGHMHVHGKVMSLYFPNQKVFPAYIGDLPM